MYCIYMVKTSLIRIKRDRVLTKNKHKSLHFRMFQHMFRIKLN